MIPVTPRAPTGAGTMKSVRYHCYGSPDVLRLERVAIPTPADDQVLVRVEAAGVNPLDWHYMRGEPYLVRLMAGIGAPDDPKLGVDFAGTVEAVGSAVTRFQPGDEVFGGVTGAFSEYVVIGQDRAIAHKPANVSFEEAGTVAIAAVTALQGLRDHGGLQPGQKVLINGASGGVGSFAVQIARSIGAEVTGVCSARNAAMVRELGANHVIDYRQENFTELGKRYDLILDMVGNHSLSDLRGVLEPEGSLVIVGAADMGNYFEPIWLPIKTSIYNLFVSQDMKGMLARLSRDDMQLLADLMQAGELTTEIDRVYRLDEIAEAIRYSESGRARGKIVIDVR